MRFDVFFILCHFIHTLNRLDAALGHHHVNFFADIDINKTYLPFYSIMKGLLLSLSLTAAFGFSPPSLRSPIRRNVLSMREEGEFTLAILGDLHLDPRSMDDHYTGRDHFMKNVLDNGNKENAAVVSLGDLGESKDCTNSGSLFAGTSECFKLAREYLDSFKVPFEVIGGNHDLEGIDEFPTDAENLDAYLKAFDKPTPYFKREISEKTNKD